MIKLALDPAFLAETHKLRSGVKLPVAEITDPRELAGSGKLLDENSLGL
jgi:hypothetical protein